MERRKFLKILRLIPFFSLLKAPVLLPEKPRQILLADFFVAGFQYHEGMNSRVFETHKEGEGLVLRREPDNLHDPLATAIFTKSGHKLGYVPRACNYSPALVADQDVRLCAAPGLPTSIRRPNRGNGFWSVCDRKLEEEDRDDEEQFPILGQSRSELAG